MQVIDGLVVKVSLFTLFSAHILMKKSSFFFKHSLDLLGQTIIEFVGSFMLYICKFNEDRVK